MKSIVVDISSQIAQLRRKKSSEELDSIYRAIEITGQAQEAAARAIEPGVSECEVQASLEYIFTGSSTRSAFPSIVATGENATVLHYTANKALLKKDELVVVDIGAEYGYYAADITRTYPVSGTFNQRQRDLYTKVLETQEYIASLAKSGMWLSNAQHPEMSLNHLARAYLKKLGYDRYFPHGIGHFLGLDVHDVGDLNEPLAEGDVITIEPGIYIRDEKVGIRIEDDYLITAQSSLCLSDDIPKNIDEIEELVQSKF